MNNEIKETLTRRLSELEEMKENLENRINIDKKVMEKNTIELKNIVDKIQQLKEGLICD